MDEFNAGFMMTLKPIGIIIGAIAIFALLIWALAELVWKAVADNSKWALLLLFVLAILAACAAVGGANFVYQNFIWKA